MIVILAILRRRVFELSYEMVTIVTWAPTLHWYIVRVIVKEGHQHDMIILDYMLKLWYLLYVYLVTMFALRHM